MLKKMTGAVSGTDVEEQFINPSQTGKHKRMQNAEIIGRRASRMLAVVAVGLLIGITVKSVRAWTAPTAAPPGGVVSAAPLTTGSGFQIRSGSFALGNGINNDSPNLYFTPTGAPYSYWDNNAGTTRLITQNGGGEIERMVIGNDGHVGIGTASPEAPLDIQGSVPNDLVQLFSNGSTQWHLGVGNASGDYFSIYEEGRSANPQLAVLKNSGNVGIGTTTPNQKLSVNGMIETFGAGGIKFPDQTIQTTAATGAGTGTANYLTKWNPAGNGLENSIVSQGTSSGVDYTITNGPVIANSGGSASYLRWYGANYLRGATFIDNVLYDENNTNYYLDPNGSSRLSNLGVGDADKINLYKYAENALAIQTSLDGNGISNYGGDSENRLLLQPVVGNVGIGTSSPWAKLTVQSAGSEAASFGGSVNSYITIGNGRTPTTGSYIQWDDNANKMFISPHGFQAIGIDSAGTVGLMGHLFTGGGVYANGDVCANSGTGSQRCLATMTGADNMGNHTATQDLNMNGYTVLGASGIRFSNQSFTSNSNGWLYEGNQNGNLSGSDYAGQGLAVGNLWASGISYARQLRDVDDNNYYLDPNGWSNLGRINVTRIGAGGVGADEMPPGWGGGISSWDIEAEASMRTYALCFGNNGAMDRDGCMAYGGSNTISFNGQNLSSVNDIYLNSIGKWASQMGSGTVTGNGTANYIAKWNSTGNGLTNSLFYDDGTNGYISGGLLVNNGLDVSNNGGTWSTITLHDDESPSGRKYIHANSNRIGFLNSGGNWSVNWDNSGNQYNVGGINAVGGLTTPLITDSDDGTYYLDPNGTSKLNKLVTTELTSNILGIDAWDSQLTEGNGATRRRSIGGAAGWDGNMLYVNGWDDWTSGVSVGGPGGVSNLNVTGLTTVSASGITFPDGTTQHTAYIPVQAIFAQ